MSTSPEPARRSRGDLAERSSLCATPFLMTKLAPSSAKSVRSDGVAPCSAGGLDPRRDLALRSNSPRLTPFRLLSRSARLALPESAFFIALTVALHVERDAAPTLQKIVVESVFQQRPKRDAAEVRL